MSDDDADIRELAKEEYDSFKTALDNVTEELKVLLIPKDPNDDKNVVIEIRGGAGGDEAALFGAELMRMYMHYADAKRWKVEEISSNMTELGGVKEVVFMVSGKGVYSKLKYESGVHRVQRVPGNRIARSCAYLDGHGCGAPGSRRRRSRNSGQGPENRHFPLGRRRRSARQ